MGSTPEMNRAMNEVAIRVAEANARMSSAERARKDDIRERQSLEYLSTVTQGEYRFRQHPDFYRLRFQG